MTTGAMIIGIAARPGRTFRTLATEPRGLASGARTLLAVGALYALTSAGLAAAGALITAPPCLVFSPDNYYALQAFFALPVFFLAWLAAAGAAYLLSRRRSQGTFEGMLAVLAPALAVPLIVIWFFAAALAVFLALGGSQEEIMALTTGPGIEQAVAFGYPILAAAWLIVLSVLAVRSARRVGWIRAAGAGLAAGFIFLGFLIVFIR
ncbi:MAG: YIP1 family protein [Candidatus Aminicenantes bacterium]|nr:YIP1 family protein [Candidatus Aminicenantes bacterium]